jgi:excisionase family DNA binding protein
VPSDELLTVEELASYLKLKPRTLYPKLRRGELPAFKIFGGWRFKKSDIEKWLRENTKSQP